MSKYIHCFLAVYSFMCAFELQICVWNRDVWERKANRFLSSAHGRGTNPQANTYVHFHQNQIHLLAVHESQIAIYDATTLECMKQVHIPHLKIVLSYLLYISCMINLIL